MNNNKRYMVLQGCYWMIFCVATGYVSLYLQGRGLSNGAIGTFTAVFGILAALLQPMLGRLCDRLPALTWKRMLLLLCAPFPIVCALMLLIPGAWIGGVLMGMLLLLANAMMPFINSASFAYRRQGDAINFGVARGVGSALFALLALLIGNLSARFGIQVVPVAGIAIAGLMLAAIAQMPCKPEAVVSAAPREVASAEGGFLRKYPAFMLMLISCLFSLTSHNLTGTYLLQIIQSLGGNGGHLGTALAIQAIIEVPVLFGFSFLLRRFRPATLMLISSVGYAVKATLFALSGSIAMIYITMLMQIFSFALFASASVYYAADSIRAEDQVTGQALMTSMVASGTVIGSLLGGWLLELTSIPTMLALNVVIAALGVVAAWLSWRKTPVKA